MKIKGGGGDASSANSFFSSQSVVSDDVEAKRKSLSFNPHLIHSHVSGIMSTSSAQQNDESEPQPALASHTVAPVTLPHPELMRVLCEYAPTEPGHLTVTPGDLLHVLRKDVSGWWLA